MPLLVPVCIFVKPPLAGVAKTRLTPTLGAENAARLARAFFLDTLDLVRSRRWARPVLATAGELPDDLAIPGEIERWPQGEGSLGARIARVLTRALAGASSAIAIGTDSPGLPPRYLDHACFALDHADAVIGPADDGGFYTLGLTRVAPGLLDDIPWSAPDTCVLTMRRLRALDYLPTVLEPWFDVDVPEDLERLAVGLSDGSIRAPHTANVLTALGAIEPPKTSERDLRRGT